MRPRALSVALSHLIFFPSLPCKAEALIQDETPFEHGIGKGGKVG